LVAYPRYVDPLRQQRCEVEDTLAHVALQRRHRAALPPVVNAPGFSRWKRPFVAAFLQGSQVDFRSRDRACGAVALWGSSPAPALLSGTSTLRIEDGFLRSSGLGADLVKPLSLVIDDLGIYYDATRPSRLEQILARTTLGASDRHRAQALREKLIALDVTKYNLGQASWDRPLTERVVLLVIGQVETDASIRFGSPEIVSNIALLRRVRAENPQAYIVYKPHPDVLAGLRQPGATEDSARLIADETLKTQVSLNRLLSGIDAVHTMTSLLGFEALIRGKLVVCHGLPFYAGWGLTEDRLACSRRTRQLSIDDLVHATLIAYPRYLDHDHRCFIEPEQAVDLLFEKSMAGPVHRRWHRRLLRAGLVTWRRLAGSR
jgi:capsular polysaccharide export protein